MRSDFFLYNFSLLWNYLPQHTILCELKLKRQFCLMSLEGSKSLVRFFFWSVIKPMFSVLPRFIQIFYIFYSVITFFIHIYIYKIDFFVKIIKLYVHFDSYFIAYGKNLLLISYEWFFSFLNIIVINK